MSEQRNYRVVFWCMFFAAAFFAVTADACHAQIYVPSDTPSQVDPVNPDRDMIGAKPDAAQDMRRTRLLNTARQRTIVSDADKLLALARQLHAGVNADGTALSTAQRMKMVTDIEKLARSVKERMTYAVTSDPVPASVFRSWQ